MQYFIVLMFLLGCCRASETEQPKPHSVPLYVREFLNKLDVDTSRLNGAADLTTDVKVLVEAIGAAEVLKRAKGAVDDDSGLPYFVIRKMTTGVGEVISRRYTLVDEIRIVQLYLIRNQDGSFRAALSIGAVG